MLEQGQIQYWGQLLIYILNGLWGSIWNLWNILGLGLYAAIALLLAWLEARLEHRHQGEVLKEITSILPFWKKWSLIALPVALLVGFANVTYQGTLDIVQIQQSDHNVNQSIEGGSGNVNIAGNANIYHKAVQRKIDELKKTEIIELLSKCPTKVTLAADMSDTEAINFMHQIKEILTTAGWECNSSRTLSNYKPGLFFSINPEQFTLDNSGNYVIDAMQPVSQLRNALANCGYQSEGFFDENLEQGIISIVVGPLSAES